MSVEITAPSSAKQGTYVNVDVLVTNTLGHHASFRTEVFAGLDLIFSTDEIILDGQSKTYNTGFTMPDDDITILAWVDRWVFDHWEYYGADSKLVTLEVEVYYTLDVVVEPPEAGYVTRVPVDIEYVSGTRVTLTANAYSGYQFVEWSGDASGTSPTVYIIMDSNKVVVASFVLVPTEPEFQGFALAEYITV